MHKVCTPCTYICKYIREYSGAVEVPPVDWETAVRRLCYCIFHLQIKLSRPNSALPPLFLGGGVDGGGGNHHERCHLKRGFRLNSFHINSQAASFPAQRGADGPREMPRSNSSLSLYSVRLNVHTYIHASSWVWCRVSQWDWLKSNFLP
jgi:hypothetical protein